MLQFDEPSHTYSFGGQIVPSVTQVLAPIKPDFSRVPPAILERKREIGNAVHLATELDDEDDLDDDSVPEEIRPYVEAWRSFKRGTGCVVIANERRVFHPVLRFAGTLDRVLKMPDGDHWLVDLKTSSELYPSYGPQLAGYELALIHNDERVDVRAAIQLMPDGKFRIERYTNPNDESVFRACLAIHHWKESNNV